MLDVQAWERPVVLGKVSGDDVDARVHECNVRRGVERVTLGCRMEARIGAGHGG